MRGLRAVSMKALGKLQLVSLVQQKTRRTVLCDTKLRVHLRDRTKNSSRLNYVLTFF